MYRMMGQETVEKAIRVYSPTGDVILTRRDGGWYKFDEPLGFDGPVRSQEEAVQTVLASMLSDLEGDRVATVRRLAREECAAVAALDWDESPLYVGCGGDRAKVVPAQFKTARETYGLSLRALARLMAPREKEGTVAQRIRRFENGEVDSLKLDDLDIAYRVFATIAVEQIKAAVTIEVLK